MYNVIISQLEKALECDDDKELRLRVEVLLDVIKDQRPSLITPQTFPQGFPQKPAEITSTYFKNEPTLTNNPPKINGPGAIVSTGEQINYKRPPNT